MVTRVIMADNDSESLCFVCFLLFVLITGNFFCFFQFMFRLEFFGNCPVFSA